MLRSQGARAGRNCCHRHRRPQCRQGVSAARTPCVEKCPSRRKEFGRQGQRRGARRDAHQPTTRRASCTSAQRVRHRQQRSCRTWPSAGCAISNRSTMLRAGEVNARAAVERCDSDAGECPARSSAGGRCVRLEAQVRGRGSSHRVQEWAVATRVRPQRPHWTFAVPRPAPECGTRSCRPA